MSKKQKTLAAAFFEDAPCEITYRDLAGRWTHRTIRIAELKRDHAVAKCELRGGGHRRFNLNCIRAAAPVGRRRWTSVAAPSTPTPSGGCAVSSSSAAGGPIGSR